MKGQNFSDAVVLGMGGSSLGPEVLAETFAKKSGFPKLHVLDSTDPAQVRAMEDKVDLANTLFIVSSKSGGTTEPNVMKDYFFDRVAEDDRRGQGRPSLHRRHRSRLVAAEGRHEAGLCAASSTAIRRSAAATPCCRRSASCRRQRPASTSRSLIDARARDGALLRRRRAAARKSRACSSGWRWGSPASKAATR